MGGSCISYGREVTPIQDFDGGNLSEKKSLGRPRRKWENNIKKEVQEVGCGCMDWIGLAHDRNSWRARVSAVMNLRVP